MRANARQLEVLLADTQAVELGWSGVAQYLPASAHDEAIKSAEKKLCDFN